MSIRTWYVILSLALVLPSSGACQPQSQHPSFVVEKTGSGPPILLIPGLTSPGSVWLKLVESLSDRHTCHVVTLAGFADVPPIDSMSAARVRAELERYIREERLDAPVLIGHSLGGFVALWVAARAPELIGGVVSVEGAPFLPAVFDTAATAATWQSRAEAMRSAIAAATPEGFAAQGNAQLARQVGDSAARAWLAPIAARSDPVTTARLLYDSFTVDLRDEVASIEAPVLLVIGTAGIAAAARQGYVANAARQLAGVGDLQISEVESARHFVMLDDPERLAFIVEQFLVRIGRSDGDE